MHPTSIRVFISVVLLAEIGSASAQHPTAFSFSIPDDTYQLIVVTSQSWSAQTGKLQRYEKEKSTWVKIGTEIPVALGKNGMAWGRGLHVPTTALEKQEGDGKAPAGIFRLGTMFGYDSVSPSAKSYPYRQSTDRDYWIDDVTSRDYNHWTAIPPDKPNFPRERWFSYEKMKRSDHLYQYGIVIDHNTNPIEPGRGSAIFFHVWRRPDAPTLGCTSMSKENLLELMGWLDPASNPLVVQSPAAEINSIKIGATHR